MNRLRTMLNDRKCFVLLAALAALLVLLGGAANALAAAGITVRCVPTTNPDPRCTPPNMYPTISAAVSVANQYDTILVAPGTYYETVTITVPNLTLAGAQAGNDARVDRHDRNNESIVDPQGTGPGIVVGAQSVVIDGFTVQNGGGTPPDTGGILVEGAGATNGTVIINNILQDNSWGATLNPEGGSLVNVLVEHNLFRNNGGFESVDACGIVAGGLTSSTITQNAFTGNVTAAMVFLGCSELSIANNTSKKDGAFVFFVDTTNSTFTNNSGEDFGAKGVLPVDPTPLPSPDAAIEIAVANSGLVISDNYLEGGKAPINNGIAFTNIFVPGYSQNIYVENNKIKRFPGNGIIAEEGTAEYSSIFGNEVEGHGNDGILIESNNTINIMLDNEAYRNAHNDCEDDTTGGATAGTDSKWFNNTGSTSSPPGLCAPGRRHYHD
jgi:hypothetical protein